jgi:hypothetical protein
MFSSLLPRPNGDILEQKDKSAAIVADIHTNVNSEYLEE